MPRDLHLLPKFADGLSFLYLEHAKIESNSSGIMACQKDGSVAIPVAALAVLLLGPGTSITHAAVKILADNGCSILWVGEECQRMYASGMGETRRSARLLKQALLWVNPKSRQEVIRRMYEVRFSDPLPPDLSLQQIRGMEGVRVRDAYAKAAKEAGVEWHGRNFTSGDWNKADPVNRALSAANSCLYGICHAAIVSAGYSPGIGFIHTGKLLSFVYDVADLFKVETVIPASFMAVKEDVVQVEKVVRVIFRTKVNETNLLSRILPTIDRVFGIPQNLAESIFDINADLPAWLWDESVPVPSGVNYGGDCA